MTEFITLNHLDTELSATRLAAMCRQHVSGAGVFFEMPDGTPAKVEKGGYKGRQWMIEDGAVVKTRDPGRPRWLLDKKDDETIIALVKSGKSMTDIAAEYGVTKSYISHILRRSR